MSEISNTSSESLFSPRSWFVGADDRIRPIWRALVFLALGMVVVTLMSGALFRFGEGIKRGGWTAGCLLLSWMMLSTLDHRSFRTLGLWFYPGWWKEMLWGIALGIALICAVVSGMVLVGVMRIEGLNALNEVQDGLGRAAFLFLTAGMFEEVVFRGYPFQRLAESVGQWGAILFFSGLFGAAHLGNPGSTALGTANTILAGVLLAAAYLKTRGLWLPTGLHWAWNYFLGPVFALPVSGGKFEPSLLRVTVSGPEWLSGGNYGPEASILLTIVCTVAIVGLWKAPWINPSPAMRDVLK